MARAPRRDPAGCRAEQLAASAAGHARRGSQPVMVSQRPGEAAAVACAATAVRLALASSLRGGAAANSERRLEHHPRCSTQAAAETAAMLAEVRSRRGRQPQVRALRRARFCVHQLSGRHSSSTDVDASIDQHAHSRDAGQRVSSAVLWCLNASEAAGRTQPVVRLSVSSGCGSRRATLQPQVASQQRSASAPVGAAASSAPRATGAAAPPRLPLRSSSAR